MRIQSFIRFLVTLVVVCSAVLSVACGQQPTPTLVPAPVPTKAPLPTATKPPEPIKLGFNMELTGVSSTSGQRMQKCAQMTVAEINAAGGVLGRPLVLVTEDNQSTPSGSVNAMNKLVENKDLVAMIGPCRSAQIQADSDIIAAAKLPWPHSGTAPVLLTLGNNYMWRMKPNDNLVGEGAVRFALEELKATKIGIMHDTEAFGVNGAKAVTEQLAKRGVTPMLEQAYTIGDKDYTAQLLNLKKAGLDAVIFWSANAEDIGIIMRQIKELDCTFKVIGSASWSSTVALKLAGQYAEGYYGVGDFVPDSNPVSKAWGDKWRKEVGDEPDLFAVMEHDKIYLVAEAIKIAGSTDTEKVNDAFLKIKDYQTCLGKVTFGPDHEGCKWMYVTQITNGKPVLVNTITW